MIFLSKKKFFFYRKIKAKNDQAKLTKPKMIIKVEFVSGYKSVSDPLIIREYHGFIRMGIRISKKKFTGYPDLKILNGGGFCYPDIIRIQTLHQGDELSNGFLKINHGQISN